MIRLAVAIAGKDLRILLSGPGCIAQALLLGLLLIFIFSLAKNPGEIIAPQEAAAIFWIGCAFCQALLFNQIYSLEEDSSARHGLLLLSAPVQGVWLGKAITGALLLCATQLVLLPALGVFLSQRLAGSIWPGLIGLLLANAGLAALGSLLGALIQGSTGRESLLSIMALPLLLPLLLAAISLGAISLGAEAEQDVRQWLGIAAAFDAIFIAASMSLFGFIYRGDY